VKSHSHAVIWLLSALAAGFSIACWSCSLFGPAQQSTVPQESHSAALRVAPVGVQRVHRKAIRPKPIYTKKQLQPPSNLQVPAPAPAAVPVVTLGSNDDAQANAQLLIDQATGKLEHLNRAELSKSYVSRYEQANDLLSAARRSLADQDYPAASSLAEKALALLNELPSSTNQ
jgi:hypothetical protein